MVPLESYFCTIASNVMEKLATQNGDVNMKKKIHIPIVARTGIFSIGNEKYYSVD